MLQSSLLGDSADLVSVADGARTIQAPEESEAVARLQQALLCLDFELSEDGVDGIFGNETGAAIAAFNTDGDWQLPTRWLARTRWPASTWSWLTSKE